MNQIITDNLEKIRIDNALSVKDMADTMGVSRETYYKILEGRNINMKSLINLHVNLNVDLNALLCSDQYDSSGTKKTNTKLTDLFIDFTEYDINPLEVRKLIMQKIAIKYFSKKSAIEQIVQNNRAILDFIIILKNIKLGIAKDKQSQAKKILSELVENAEIKFSENSVKKNILNKLSILTNKDCYHILNFPNIFIEILLSNIPKNDSWLIEKLGYDCLFE